MNPQKIIEAIHELRERRTAKEMNRVAVINVVGLTESLIGEHTPRIAEFAKRGALAQHRARFSRRDLHGAIELSHRQTAIGTRHRRQRLVSTANLAEVHFWKQSNHLVQSAENLGCAATIRRSDSTFTIANCFWWFNMYSSVDYSITPRPIYRADGGKIFDIYSWPYSIREEIKKDLGEFPFFGFWGPAAGIDSPQGRPIAPRAGLPSPRNGLKINFRRR